MRTEQLEYLVELSKFNSINAASEHLHISHQSLNKSISSLETELSTKLINRNTKGIYFTHTGKQTLECARRILQEIENLRKSIEDISQESIDLEGSVSIVGTPATLNALLTPMAREIKKKHPKVKITLIESNPASIPDLLREDTFDFGIVNFPKNFISSLHDLSYDVLYHEQTVAIVSKDSDLSHLSSISLQSLLERPLLIYSASIEENNLIFNMLSKYGKLDNLAHTNSLQAYYESLSEGIYFSVVNPSVYFSIPSIFKENIRMVPLKEKIVSTTYLVQCAHPRHSKLLDQLIDHLKAQYLG